MRPLKIYLLLLFAAAAAQAGDLKVSVVPLAASASSAAAPAPSVPNSFAVLAPEVSNLDPIKVRFSIDDPALVKTSPTGNSAEPQFELTATDEHGQTVPVRYTVTGQRVEYSHVTIDVAVQIPVDTAERQRQVSALVDAAIAEATGDNRTYLIANRSITVQMFDRLFLQNRVGDFTVHIRLRDPRIPPAEAEARMRITDKGTFTDRIRHRDAEMNRK
jgi:hypothetical protein